jgi:hypothetical protein
MNNAWAAAGRFGGEIAVAMPDKARKRSGNAAPRHEIAADPPIDFGAGSATWRN